MDDARFLRSQEHALATEAAAALTVASPLTRAWYGDRLDPDCTGKSIEHLQRLLTEAGLTADFWHLS